MAEKRLQYLAEDINMILDKSVLYLETEADRELLTNSLRNAGGLGRCVFVIATKKYYKFNVDTSTWTQL